MRQLTTDTPGKARLTDLAVLAGLALFWAACVALVNPVGDFPLNDDWSYGACVYTLVETGTFRLGDWVSMPLVVQVLWGALFCLPAGFSFTALRASTLVLGCVGVLSTYGLLRTGGARRRYAALGALLLAANPVYLQLAHTFMTDVPFTATASLAALLLLRGVQREDRRAVVAGTIAAVAATLIRQVGLVVPAAFAASYLVRHGFNPRRAAPAAVPLAVTAGALLAYNAWLATHQPLPALYHVQTTELSAALRDPLRTAGQLVVGLFKSVWLLGLFSLPLMLCASGPHRGAAPRWRRAIYAGVLLAFAATAIVWIARGWWLPNVRNILAVHGVGPVLLRDVADLPRHLPPLPGWFWLTTSVVAAAGGGLLLWQTFGADPAVTTADAGSTRDPRSPPAAPDPPRSAAGPKVRPGRAADGPERSDKAVSTPAAGRPAAVFGLAVLACYLPPMHAIEPFDRYLVFALPFWWLAVAGTGALARNPDRLPRRRAVAAWAGAALLPLYAFYAVAATHDYLALHRARWQLLDGIRASGVPVSDIDGGFEFNSLFRLGSGNERVPAGDQHWFREHQFTVTLGPMGGYEEVASEPFDRWLPPAEQKVYLLKRVR